MKQELIWSCGEGYHRETLPRELKSNTVEAYKVQPAFHSTTCIALQRRCCSTATCHSLLSGIHFSPFTIHHSPFQSTNGLWLQPLNAKCNNATVVFFFSLSLGMAVPCGVCALCFFFALGVTLLYWHWVAFAYETKIACQVNFITTQITLLPSSLSLLLPSLLLFPLSYSFPPTTITMRSLD